MYGENFTIYSKSLDREIDRCFYVNVLDNLYSSPIPLGGLTYEYSYLYSNWFLFKNWGGIK